MGHRITVVGTDCKEEEGHPSSKGRDAQKEPATW